MRHGPSRDTAREAGGGVGRGRGKGAGSRDMVAGANEGGGKFGNESRGAKVNEKGFRDVSVDTVNPREGLDVGVGNLATGVLFLTKLSEIGEVFAEDVRDEGVAG